MAQCYRNKLFILRNINGNLCQCGFTSNSCSRSARHAMKSALAVSSVCQIPRWYTTSPVLFVRNRRTGYRPTVLYTEDSDVKKESHLKDDPELKAIVGEIHKHFDETTDDRQRKIGDEKKPGAKPNQPKPEDAISQSLQDRFVIYRDEDAEVILDESEIEQLKLQEEEGDYQTTDVNEQEQFSIYRQKRDDLAGQNLQRGKKGVFDIQELVSVLQDENARDICVISISPELHYANYLVIVSAMSPRHLRAISEFIRKLHKNKKGQNDRFVPIEGQKSCSDWHALDMGNIVLHIFMPETRERYDLETLWSVGREFDDLTQRIPEDVVLTTLQSYTKFLDDVRPPQNEAAAEVVSKPISS